LEKTKVCKKCGQEFPATKEYFYKNKGTKDKFQGVCKKCASKSFNQYYGENKEFLQARNRQWYSENKEHVAEYDKQYRKDHPEQTAENKERWTLEHKDYWVEYSKKYYLEHQEGLKEKSRKFRSEHKEYYIEYNRQWRKDNPEKQKLFDIVKRLKKRELPATLTEKQWQIIKERFSNKCAYCGKEKPLEQEHFIALSKDGEYTINNIIPACRNCNASKHKNDFFQWYSKQPYYSKLREKAILKFLGYDKYGTQQPMLWI
jgi:5-methylcytosine-specific restriction endonuclease McrA